MEAQRAPDPSASVAKITGRMGMSTTSYTHATLQPMATGAAAEEGVTKLVRVTLTDAQWRQLRVKAAEQDVSLTRLLGSILASEADRGGV
jgi:hypothetical protein